MSTIGGRLREERERLGLSQTAFGALAGVQKQTQVNYEADKRRPDGDYLAAIAAKDVDVQYVITGRRSASRSASPSSGSSPSPGATWPFTPKSSRVLGLLPGAVAYMTAEDAPAWLVSGSDKSGTHSGGESGAPEDGPPVSIRALLPHTGVTALRPLVLSVPLGDGGDEQDLNYQVIPKHLRPASAGYGKEVGPSDQPIDLAGDFAFSYDWLRKNLGHTSGQLASVQVRGDSMSSTLLDGDTIMIDQAAERVDVDGIYVLELYGRRVVKRVQHLFDGTLVLISDNPSYQRETIPRDQARDVRVIGRMVWPRVR